MNIQTLNHEPRGNILLVIDLYQNELHTFYIESYQFFLNTVT